MTATIVGKRAYLPRGRGLVDGRDARIHSGRCVNFDGSGDGMYGTTTFDINGSGDTTTLSCWFYADTDSPASLSGGNTTIVGNTKANATNNFAIYTTGTNEVAAIAYYASSSSVKVSTGSILTTGNWYHVAATFDKDSATIKIYLDGKEYSATPSLGYGGTDNTFEIGFRHLGGGGSQAQHFNGKIADVKMFDIAFTAAQALEQYQNPEQVLPTGASASNLKRWYPLNDYDISGATNLDALYMQDASGNGKHLLVENCGMAFSEPALAPQLGLRSSSSRMVIQDDETVTISSAAGINIFSGADGGGTVAFWIFVNSDGESSHGRVLWKSGDYELITRNESSGTCELQLEVSGFSGGTAIHRSAKSIAIGAWTHVVMTYTGLYNANPIFYINGAATTNAADTQTTGTFTDSGDLVLGNKSDGSRSIDGILSEVAMWSSILDADAVTVLYNSGAQGFDPTSDSGNYDVSSDLTAFYRLDNPVTIADLSTNSNAGTVAGTPAMATVPEGTTSDLSVLGSLTTTRLGSSVLAMPPVGSTTGALGGYASMPQPAFGTQNFTVAIWAKCASFISGYPYLFNFAAGSNTYGVRCFVVNDSGALQFNYEGDTTSQTGSGTVSGLFGKWTFIVFQRLGAASFTMKARLIDAASYAFTTNKTVDVGNMTESGPSYIGNYAGASNSANGAIACPRVYLHGSSSAFSEAELNSIFEQGKRFLIGDS